MGLSCKFSLKPIHWISCWTGIDWYGVSPELRTRVKVHCCLVLRCLTQNSTDGNLLHAWLIHQQTTDSVSSFLCKVFQIYLMHTWYTQVTVHLRKMIWRSYVNRWLSADVPGILYSELNNSVWWFLLGYSHVFPKSSKCYWNLVSGFPIWKKKYHPWQPPLCSQD